MSVKHGEYSAAVRLGRNLKDRCTKVDPEREVIATMLDQLKNKWNSLRSVANQRYYRLVVLTLMRQIHTVFFTALHSVQGGLSHDQSA